MNKVINEGEHTGIICLHFQKKCFENKVPLERLQRKYGCEDVKLLLFFKTKLSTPEKGGELCASGTDVGLETEVCKIFLCTGYTSASEGGSEA